MISLKRFMDVEQTSATLLRALAEAYKETLAAAGAGAAQACPSADPDLVRHLTQLGQQMAAAETTDAIGATGTQVSSRLQEWGDVAANDLRRKTEDVKELLVTLANTAASVAASDAEHVIRFDGLTARLQKIATLDDVTQLRSAVLASASELRSSVETMSKSTRTLLKTMQGELDTYQSRLEDAEKVASHDPLTGLLNRRKLDSVITRKIERGAAFSIGLIDLDGFKGINDRLGHRAGDELLTLFSADLKANARPTDVVGRWGGDEFMVIIDGSSEEARTHFNRVRQWVAGTYTLTGAQGVEKVQIDLSIGVAEWKKGLKVSDIIEEADRRMYAAKRTRR